MLRGPFRPLGSPAMWRSLLHAVLGLPLGLLACVPTVALLASSVGFLPVFPLTVITVALLFWWTERVGRVERHRLAALHLVDLPDPIPPLAPGSWWSRWKQRLTSRPRWKGIAYAVLHLPVAAIASSVLLALLGGSLALLTLPATVWAMPGDTAHFWLFEVSSWPGLVGAAAVGLMGLLVVAPWSALGVGHVDVAFTRWLLGPNVGKDLEARVTVAETGRAAAVDAAEAERRRIERDLHDGAQQRLVALAMDLGAARQRLETDPEGGRALVAEAHEEAKAALRELRDLVRGIHPVILEDRGLDAALSAVVARSPIPVDLQVDLPERPPAPVESAAYFVVSEALANVARHAGATRARVAIVTTGDRLIVEVRDDGTGGADPAGGTGLTGLRERVTGMGGTFDLLSPVGGPTTVLVELPCAS